GNGAAGVDRDGRGAQDDCEGSGRGGGAVVNDREGEAVVVVRADLGVADLARVDVALGEGAIDRQRDVIDLERAVRGRCGDGVDELAGRIAGVANGGQLGAGDDGRRAFAEVERRVDGDGRRRLGEGDRERPRGGRAGGIGDREGEAVVVVR